MSWSCFSRPWAARRPNCRATASGREIYIKKDGTYTYTYDPMDKVVVGDRKIDVHIRKLRQKIGEQHIVTVKGVGYKFEPAE